MRERIHENVGVYHWYPKRKAQNKQLVTSDGIGIATAAAVAPAAAAAVDVSVRLVL